MKPKKIPYRNQEKITLEFMKFIRPLFKKYKEIESAYLWGSLVGGSFGLYEKRYRNQIGSDVDLVIFTKNGRIPKKWKLLAKPPYWFRLYKDKDFRDFNYKKNIHKVDLIVALPGKTVKDLGKNNKEEGEKFKRIR